jgi:hypothetical protein
MAQAVIWADFISSFKCFIMKKIVIPLMTLCLIADFSFAQHGTIDTAKTKILLYNFAPFGNKALSNSISNIALSSTFNNGENGKIDFKYVKNFLTAGLSLDQKIGKGDNQATFYKFSDGVSPGTTVSFNLQKVFWDPKLSDKSFSEFNKIRNAYAIRVGKDPRHVTYDEVVQQGNSDEKEQMAAIKLKQPVFFNFKAGFTKTSFSFVTDSVSLANTDKNFITPDISLSIGLPARNLKSYLSLVYVFSASYEGADDQTFYRPFGNSGNYYGQTLSFGEPQKKTDHKLTLEWRKNFQRTGEAPDFAIDPSFTYGFNSNKAALALPIYFIKGATSKDKPKGLQGGISLGYLSKLDHLSSFKDGFGAQLVLTTPFDVFKSFK